MEKEFVEVIEIWQPVEKGGEAYHLEKGNLKKIALLVNGHPVLLEKDFFLEKHHLTKEDAKSKGLL